MQAKRDSGFTNRLQAALEHLSVHRGRSDARAHLEMVRVQVDALARGDLDAALARAQPDVTLGVFAPPDFAWILNAQGAAGLRHALEHNFQALDHQRPEITDVYAEGDTVVLFGREQGRIRATGQAYDVEFVEKFTFRDDRLASVRIIAAHARTT